MFILDATSRFPTIPDKALQIWLSAQQWKAQWLPQQNLLVASGRDCKYNQQGSKDYASNNAHRGYPKPDDSAVFAKNLLKRKKKQAGAKKKKKKRIEGVASYVYICIYIYIYILYIYNILYIVYLL